MNNYCPYKHKVPLNMSASASTADRVDSAVDIQGSVRT